METMLKLLIPVLALAIPVCGICVYGITEVVRLRIEEARARAGIPGDRPENLTALHDEIAELRRELKDVHERLEYTEMRRLTNRDRQAGESLNIRG